MINGLEINCKEVIDQTLSFLGNGLGNVLGSYIQYGQYCS